MSDRARLSERKSWRESSPPGATFLGSTDFPNSLVNAVEKWDPAGFFLGPVRERTDETYARPPSETEKSQKLIPLLRSTLAGKRILNLAGGADKLVPYHRSEPFLRWLKGAIAPAASGGWFGHGDVYLEDRVFEGVGHAATGDMLDVANRFIVDTLELEAKKAPLLEGAAKL